MGLFGDDSSTAVAQSTTTTVSQPASAAGQGLALVNSQIINGNPTEVLQAAGALLKPFAALTQGVADRAMDLQQSQITAAAAATSQAAASEQHAAEIAAGRALSTSLPVDWNALAPYGVWAVVGVGVVIVVYLFLKG